MTAVTEDAFVISVAPDFHDLPLDADVTIDAAEYARIMRGIATADGGSATPVVSAFNSSI
jgi:hypothetical protein